MPPTRAQSKKKRRSSAGGGRSPKRNRRSTSPPDDNEDNEDNEDNKDNSNNQQPDSNGNSLAPVFTIFEDSSARLSFGPIRSLVHQPPSGVWANQTSPQLQLKQSTSPPPLNLGEAAIVLPDHPVTERFNLDFQLHSSPSPISRNSLLSQLAQAHIEHAQPSSQDRVQNSQPSQSAQVARVGNDQPPAQVHDRVRRFLAENVAQLIENFVSEVENNLQAAERAGGHHHPSGDPGHVRVAIEGLREGPFGVHIVVSPEIKAIAGPSNSANGKGKAPVRNHPPAGPSTGPQSNLPVARIAPRPYGLPLNSEIPYLQLAVPGVNYTVTTNTAPTGSSTNNLSIGPLAPTVQPSIEPAATNTGLTTNPPSSTNPPNETSAAVNNSSNGSSANNGRSENGPQNGTSTSPDRREHVVNGSGPGNNLSSQVNGYSPLSSSSNAGPLPGHWETPPRFDRRLYQPIGSTSDATEPESARHWTLCLNEACNALLPLDPQQLRQHLEICTWHSRDWTSRANSPPTPLVHFETATLERPPDLAFDYDTDDCDDWDSEGSEVTPEAEGHTSQINGTSSLGTAPRFGVVSVPVPSSNESESEGEHSLTQPLTQHHYHPPTHAHLYPSPPNYTSPYPPPQIIPYPSPPL